MLSKFLIFLTFCQVVLSDQFAAVAKGEWELYKLTYKKHYENAVEDQFRMNIFMENKLRVIEHNQLYERNLTSYKMAINHLSDKLHSEILSTMHGLRVDMKTAVGGEMSRGSTYIPPDDDVVIPKSVDWRTKGIVTPVKDQGECGSCWAFAATGALEGQEARKTGKLVSLSEQDLIDCCLAAGGCHGGFMTVAFECIRQERGIESEEDYPYEVAQGECRFNLSKAVATDSGYAEISHGNEETLKKAVATVGPISVGILAKKNLSQYSSGVYYEEDCTGHPNHGVLVVGYGTEDGQDYWLVKNSWGAKWGDHGYVKMARNRGNNCRIASAASFPLV